MSNCGTTLLWTSWHPREGALPFPRLSSLGVGEPTGFLMIISQSENHGSPNPTTNPTSSILSLTTPVIILSSAQELSTVKRTQTLAELSFMPGGSGGKSLSSWPASEKGRLEKEDQPLPSTDLRHCDLHFKTAKIWMTCQLKPLPYPIARAVLCFVFSPSRFSKHLWLQHVHLWNGVRCFTLPGYKKTAILCFCSLLLGMANSVGTCARARTKSYKISMSGW